MLLKGKSWAESTKLDLEAVTIPKLKPSRILHIHQTIIPRIGNAARPWCNSVAAKELSDEESERINRGMEPHRKRKRMTVMLRNYWSFLIA